MNETISRSAKMSLSAVNDIYREEMLRIAVFIGRNFKLFYLELAECYLKIKRSATSFFVIRRIGGDWGFYLRIGHCNNKCRRIYTETNIQFYRVYK